ncbi:unnamed protein product [Arabidopsis thaliana]|nr:unnamed protein product [Arabidopsis thaliana]
MYKYLGSELIVVHDDGVVVRKKLVVSGLEKIVVSLKLFCFPTSSAILKPDSHLPWLERIYLFGSEATLLFRQLVVVKVIVVEILRGAKEGPSL